MRQRAQRASSSGSGAVDPSCCVAEVMGTDLFTLTPDTVVASALRLSAAKRIRHFLVIEDGNLTGIVCQSDLRQARDSSLVGTCMKTPVLCIGPETTVQDAADIMEQNAVGCLPVVTGAFLVGMITRDRLSKLTGKEVRSTPSGDVSLEDVLAEAPDDSTCAACGRETTVKPYLRSGMLSLCKDCAALMPASDPKPAN
jgi:CBS domain-containing protein